MRSITPAPALVAALCLFCGVTAQRGNYVDEGAFDYGEPVPQRGAPRPAPAFRPSSSLSATGPKPTPVPILKQINRHNEDGSYTYGYEGADGAFKIETKLATGEVMGKYGYVDDAGKVRVVEYGANKYGFQPAGEGITVAPPTLVDETATKRKGIADPQGRESVEYDDGQYYEEAPVRAAPAPRPVSRPAPRPAPQPQYSQQPEPQYSQQSQPQFSQQSQPQFSQQSQPQFSQQSQPQFSPDSFPSFRSSQNFGPAPSRPAPSSSLGPVPPRAAVAGAAPVGPAPSYSQPRPQAAAPRPAPRPQPQQQSFFAPAPVYESRPAPAPVAQSQPSRSSYGRSGGILDQLEKDYALPSNSAPALHDITFGSY